jgi:hypothetical protein
MLKNVLNNVNKTLFNLGAIGHLFPLLKYWRFIFAKHNNSNAEEENIMEKF